MAEANAHYYATRDPLGAQGDFITAPEISQMFGELVGLCLADLWVAAGKPKNTYYVELGPGRGTLAADALRATRAAGFEPRVHLVETSPVLRRAQAQLLPMAHWHDDIATLPEDGPLLVVANEFFDALPVRQLISTEDGWCERVVERADTGFVPIAGRPVAEDALPTALRRAPAGTIYETSPASIAIMHELARRIAVQGGAGLIIDYGHERTSAGETLQAVHGHQFADPWHEPGERDLTAHVDFEMLARAANASGLRVIGPVNQGPWLEALGISVRAQALAAQAPDRGSEIETARQRLVAADEMGELFKVMAVVAEAWPQPAAF